ncbi:apoptosis regulatory protein Siva-like [Dermacentor albipictus]|uniref:apoptosis regulatory protein Siva-like n=1 Tax=Dermacentor albipictus TaxID=60249 RepID=UPI0031FBC473
MKRTNPFADDVPIQNKFYASEREVDKKCEKRMSAVYSKTLRMLYSASHQRHETSKPHQGAQANESTAMDTQPQPCSACHRKCAMVTSCAFCDRPSCDSCTRLCASCEKAYCTLCSVLRYTQHGEYATCLSCGN